MSALLTAAEIVRDEIAAQVKRIGAEPREAGLHGEEAIPDIQIARLNAVAELVAASENFVAARERLAKASENVAQESR